MKFTEKLAAHLTPEWRQQYISYAELKEMILLNVENAPSATTSSTRFVLNYFAKFEEDFMFECEKELRKVNTFYAEKLAEASRRYDVLNAALDDIIGEVRLRVRATSGFNLHVGDDRIKPKQKKATIGELKNAFSELYLSLVLLQNYKMLNHTGFQKIMKKHDKLLGNTKGKKWFEEKVEDAYFYKNKDLENLMREVENNFTEYLESGDRAQAMKRLRVPPLEEVQDIATVFRVGLFLGAFIIMLCFILIIAIFGDADRMDIHIHDLILFRGPFYIVMYLFLIGINVYNWRRFGVNHILIFEINPRQHLTYSHILELHAIFGVIWCLCLLGYVYSDYLNVPHLVFPLVFVAVLLVFLLNPLPIFHRSARSWLLRLVGRVVAAPFYQVGFADFWFGDQLNSMVSCVLDFKYLVCFYIHNHSWGKNYEASKCLENDHIWNGVVRCLPSWFRFAQCLKRYTVTGLAYPFLVNAGKYAASFPMVVCLTLFKIYKDDYEHTFQSPFAWLYIVTAFIQTFYCICWDLLVDFGLCQTLQKHIFLRTRIIYTAGFYYFVIIENVVLRFSWAVSLYLVNAKYLSSYNMDTMAGCLEIIRRYIWNYVRLENEHLFNVGQFRAVRDIHIKPIRSGKSTVQIEKMMDKKDGVFNRFPKDSGKISAMDDFEEDDDDDDDDDYD